jgi:hypothetical protein
VLRFHTGQKRMRTRNMLWQKSIKEKGAKRPPFLLYRHSKTIRCLRDADRQ